MGETWCYCPRRQGEMPLHNGRLCIMNEGVGVHLLLTLYYFLDPLFNQVSNIEIDIFFKWALYVSKYFLINWASDSWELLLMHYSTCTLGDVSSLVEGGEEGVTGVGPLVSTTARRPAEVHGRGRRAGGRRRSATGRGSCRGRGYWTLGWTKTHSTLVIHMPRHGRFLLLTTWSNSIRHNCLNCADRKGLTRNKHIGGFTFALLSHKAFLLHNIWQPSATFSSVLIEKSNRAQSDDSIFHMTDLHACWINIIRTFLYGNVPLP